jgi:hypothetical protein
MLNNSRYFSPAADLHPVVPLETPRRSKDYFQPFLLAPSKMNFYSQRLEPAAVQKR